MRAATASRTPAPRELVTLEPDDPARRLVVGVDGSDSAEQALRWALREADAGGATGSVVAALAYGPLGRPPGLPTLQAGENDGLVPAAEELLREAVARATSDRDTAVGPTISTTTVSTITVFDEPVAGLLGLLHPTDVLVLGSRGWGTFRRLMLGSVATQCFQQHPGAVIVVRGSAPSRDRRPVLVGVDGSPDSLVALRWAASFAHRHEAPLRVVRAWPAPSSLHPSLRSLIDRERELDTVRAHLRRLVRSTSSGISGLDGLAVTTAIVDDSPASALKAASNGDVQLLVVGRGGPTALRRRPLGSTALSCALNAGASVAVLPSAHVSDTPSDVSAPVELP